MIIVMKADVAADSPDLKRVIALAESYPGITALPIQGLFGAICHGTQQLVAQGTLRVSSSLTGIRNLVWETPSEDKAANG